MMHPFMPFVSEEIWQVIRPYMGEPNLAAHLPIAKFPEPSVNGSAVSGGGNRDEHCIEATEAVNRLRSLLGYHPGQRVKVDDADRMTGTGHYDEQFRLP